MLDLAPWTLVGGKGGVGKTTTAAGLAIQLADAGERVLVVSLDPAHSLGDALGITLGGGDPMPVPGVPGLEALEIDAGLESDRFLATRRGQLLRLIERGTYLDEQDAAGFVDLAVPGLDEIAALLRLIELVRTDTRRVVIDTAPTGHTIRLLELPSVARTWIAALEAMEEKHRAVAEAFGGRMTPDDVTEMLGSLDADISALDARLRDPVRTRFVLVSTAEPIVLAETRRFRTELERLGIACGGTVINRAAGAADPGGHGPVVRIPTLRFSPVGVDRLRRLMDAARVEVAGVPDGGPPARVHACGGPFDVPLDRTLYIVGGKGGVGKSTAACALAVRLADRGRGRVLLLGTDPAGSLGDVLGMAVGSGAVAVPGAPGLEARELDAGGAWHDFRDEYRADAERLFAGLLGGLSATSDARVVERLIDLAPPGIDELMALIEMVELLESGDHDAIVLDTAPTGHLLRLLEMPGVALEWSHTLLRLLLRYREVIGLGEMAGRVLRLSRSLRALIALLTDPARCWLLAVALPESLSVPETGRLVRRLEEVGVPLGALLVNRALESGAVPDPDGHVTALTGAAPGAQRLAAPRLAGGPCGVAELRSFVAAWRHIEAQPVPRSGRGEP
jgi:arsenite/tail-anchored protein-transporting ATPase